MLQSITSAYNLGSNGASMHFLLNKNPWRDELGLPLFQSNSWTTDLQHSPPYTHTQGNSLDWGSVFFC